MPRQATKRIRSETRLLRANGFRRKLLSASDVVSSRSDYFTFQTTFPGPITMCPTNHSLLKIKAGI